MEGTALRVCTLQELFRSDLWSKMAPVLPQPTGTGEGGAEQTLGKLGSALSWNVHFC